MSSVMDNDKVSVYAELTRTMGIEVLAPDINLSGVHFLVEGNKIRFALSAIRNVGEVAIGRVVEVRERGGKFKSLLDFCCRVHLNDFTKRALENLIKAGCFDSIDRRRTALLASLNDAFQEGHKNRRDLESGQVGLFGEDETEQNFELAKVPERPKKEILAWEKDALGFYISSHPLEEFAEKFSNFATLRQIKNAEFPNGKKIKVGGIISEAKRLNTKKGDLMAFMTLEDFSDSLKVTIFPKVFQHCLNAVVPEEIVVVVGRVELQGDNWQILADEVIAAENYSPDFYLTVAAPLENPATYDRLGNIFERHKGGSSIFMNRLGKWKKLSSNIKISDSENLREELKNLLGAENVKIY